MNAAFVCDNCRTVVGQGLSHSVVANGACEIGPSTAIGKCRIYRVRQLDKPSYHHSPMVCATI